MQSKWKNTGSLDPRKLDYIKTVVHSRVPDKLKVEFEYIWGLCHSSLSKSYQTLCNNARRNYLTFFFFF